MTQNWKLEAPESQRLKYWAKSGSLTDFDGEMDENAFLKRFDCCGRIVYNIFTFSNEAGSSSQSESDAIVKS